MANSSSTGGFLTPDSRPAPLIATALEDFLQAIVAGITGIDGQLVRPRWQAIPPQQPPQHTDWCAIGIIEREADLNPYLAHDGTANDGRGADHMQRHETLTLLCSFYGPQADTHASLMRDGLYMAQNREGLTEHGFGLVETGTIRTVPEPVNQVWVRRCDIEIRVRRVIERTYRVENIKSASGTIGADDGLTTNWSTP